MLKQICPIIMLILALELVSAQSGIDITLSTYDSTSNEAKIQIINLDDIDYHDIYLTIDTWTPVKIVNTLGAKSGAVILKIIPPGERVLKVTTQEGVSVEKKMNFLKTASQIQEEIEEVKKVSGGTTGSAAEKEAQRIEGLREKQREFLEKSEQEQLTPEEEFEAEEETAKPAEKPVQEPKKGNKGIVILIILLFFIFVVYLIFKKRRK